MYGQTFTPGSTGESFHSKPGQDDWRSDTRDIAYFHIYGQQHGETTIGQMRAQNLTICLFEEFACTTFAITDIVLTQGDKTVPTVSASRTQGPFDLNDPDATLFAVVATSDDDDDAEHNGMMRNPEVHAKIIEYLLSESSTTRSAAQRRMQAEPNGVAVPPAPQHRLIVAGAGTVLITDESANELLLYPDQSLGNIPGASSFRLGSGVVMAILPTSPARSFTVGLVVGSGPMAIELTTGTEAEVTRAARFLDLDLVAGNAAMLTVSGSTISDLAYDSNGDGSFDSSILPTVDVSGAEAADTVAPVITVRRSRGSGSSGTITVTIEAVDAVSGPRTAYYSLDGSQYQEVTQPIGIDVNTDDTLWIWADDAVGNRATRVISLIEPNLIFADGFESANWDGWDAAQP